MSIATERNRRDFRNFNPGFCPADKPRHKIKPNSGFTLVELLAAMAVLAIVLTMMLAILSATINVTVLSTHHIDTDSEARAVFDRMAIDFGRMVIRPDVDYYLKQAMASSVPTTTTSSFYSTALGQWESGSPDEYKPVNAEAGSGSSAVNDQIAFYSQVPGYYASGGTTAAQGPLSLVSYRINGDSNSANYNSMERLGCGLVWSATGQTNESSGVDVPIVYMPTYLTTVWPQAGDLKLKDPNNSFESIGPDVFRLEYYYILKKSSTSSLTSVLSNTPWDSTISHTALTGWQDVAGINVTIAVYDPQTRSMVTPSQLANLINYLPDFNPTSAQQLQALWQNGIQSAVTAGVVPSKFGASVRVYSRTFYLNTPTPQ